MKPDTFSQYGYADAAHLRALRRGYGHDIYPQYPAAYDVPRVIAGLGAFTHKGFTVDYYAASTSFSDKNFKKLYEGMRNADIEFQKNATFVLSMISPAFSAIEFASGGKVKAADLRKALRLKLPTWGVALVLEVAAGKRPLDAGFRAAMKECAKDMEAAKAAFGVVTGLSATVSVLAAAPPTAFLAGALPVLVPLAVVAGTATGVAVILEPIFKSLASGKPPTTKQMTDMMNGAARLSGQPPPSTKEINTLVNDFGKAMTLSATPTKPATAAPKTTLVFESKPTPVLPPAPTKAGFPVVPLIAALGVLGVAIIVLKK